MSSLIHYCAVFRDKKQNLGDRTFSQGNADKFIKSQISKATENAGLWVYQESFDYSVNHPFCFLRK